MNSAYHRLYRTLGIKIAYYRNMKDMSQEQLGDRLEIDQSHVSKIERASIGISMDMLCDIAKELGVEPYLLLKPKD